jgi:hypothetical protein
MPSFGYPRGVSQSARICPETRCIRTLVLVWVGGERKSSERAASSRALWVLV